MSELKQFDDTVHNEDEYETPQKLFDSLCDDWQIYPVVDVAANDDNTKCQSYMPDALRGHWTFQNKAEDLWCNPPHSLTEEFVKKAYHEWQLHNMNILMLLPANSICAHYFDEIFENTHIHYHRIAGPITFLQNGRKTKFPARNRYFIVIWEKRN